MINNLIRISNNNDNNSNDNISNNDNIVIASIIF